MSGTHGFKFEAPDGKMRIADVLDSEGVAILAKNYPNNRANDFLDWFTYSDNTLDGQSRKKAYQLYESGLLQRLEPGDAFSRFMPIFSAACMILPDRFAQRIFQKADSLLPTACISLRHCR